jgi:hypothetical protein
MEEEEEEDCCDNTNEGGGGGTADVTVGGVVLWNENIVFQSHWMVHWMNSIASIPVDDRSDDGSFGEVQSQIVLIMVK